MFTSSPKVTWNDVMELGLPPAFASEADITKEVKIEVLGWLNSTTYNTCPIAFLKRYQLRLDRAVSPRKHKTTPSELLENTYTIVHYYTMQFFNLDRVEYQSEVSP